MTFELKITLGNSAMQTSDDVAAALVQTAINITRHVNNDRTFEERDGGFISDANGNQVGEWSVYE